MDLKASRTFVVDTIREAGEIAKKYFHQPDLESHSKGGSDFVTKADLEVDAFLRDRLSKEFPETQFLTEETAPKDYSGLENVEYLWIIDPIDGTTNFSRNDDHYAISIGLAHKGQIVLGVMYLPSEEKLYHAIREEKDAFCNDKAITVSAISDPTYASVGCDWSWDFEERKKMLSLLANVVTHIRQPRSLGSAAADMAKVAVGELDGYIGTGVKPWDVAAACLFLEKAGGKITQFDGSQWNVFVPSFVATNGLLHDKLINLIK